MAAASVAVTGCTARAEGWWARGGRGTCSIGLGGASTAMAGGAATTALSRDGERAGTTSVVTDDGTVLGTGMDGTTDGLLVLATSVTAELIAVDVLAVSDTLISDKHKTRSTHDAISNMHYAYNIICVMLNSHAC